MESLGGLLFPLLILLLFVPIFLSGRKQRRQAQDMAALQGALEVGDVVTTTSGLRGTVVDTSYTETVDLEIADGVVTTWLRAAVRDKVAETPEAAGDPVVEPDAVDAPTTTPTTTPAATTTPADPIAPAGSDGSSATTPSGIRSEGAGDTNGSTRS
jgi:preprotein translocase subunit YajC